jgi:hypothetical protein
MCRRLVLVIYEQSRGGGRGLCTLIRFCTLIQESAHKLIHGGQIMIEMVGRYLLFSYENEYPEIA